MNRMEEFSLRPEPVIQIASDNTSIALEELEGTVRDRGMKLLDAFEEVLRVDQAQWNRSRAFFLRLHCCSLFCHGFVLLSECCIGLAVASAGIPVPADVN